MYRATHVHVHVHVIVKEVPVQCTYTCKTVVFSPSFVNHIGHICLQHFFPLTWEWNKPKILDVVTNSTQTMPLNMS